MSPDNWPSVTEILSPWTNFNHVHPEVLEKACLRGSITHSYIEKIIKKELDSEMVLMMIQEDYRGYVESFLKWYELVGEIIFCEDELICRTNRFKGHPDLVCRSRNGKLWLIDFKTARAHSKSWKLQLRAYSYLVEVTLDESPDIVATLRLDTDGKHPKLDQYKQNYSDLAIFLSALNVWRYFNG